MKKTWLAVSATSLLLLLGACNTASEEPKEEDPVAVEQNEEGAASEVEEQVEEVEEAEEVETSTDNSTSTNDSTESNDQQVVTPTADGEVVKAEQYEITLLKEYSFTPEEPGRDVIYLDRDENIFMRVEVEPFAQETFDFFKENGEEFARAIGDDVKVSTETNVQNAKQVTSYRVATNEATVTVLVYEMNGHAVRLTLFDEPEEKYTNDFIEMGSTIR